MRRHTPPAVRTVVLAAALATLIVPRAVPHAQQAATSPTPKALVPVAASTLSADPDAYYGQYVTLVAAVDERLAPTVFSVDQDKSKRTGKDVLILAPRLNTAVEANAYVTVIGEVVRFDPEEIARKSKDYPLDLAPDVASRYRGRPAVLATAVITTALVDLTKRLPPPMTADEEAYSRIMKRVGPAFTTLRQAVTASNADAAKEVIGALKQGFTDAEAFWKTRGTLDAMGWAQDARTHVDAIERAATAGKWDDVKASATSLGQACQSCHGKYRERMEDGTYRLKMEAK